MSTSTTLQAGQDGDGYSIVHRGGCTLVIGSMPVKDFTALTKACGRGAVLSPHLARLAGANFAWGSPANVKALADHLTEQSGQGTSGIERWLAVGQHGLSSLAMCQHLTGRAVAKSRSRTAHPHDPDDFSRCVELLETAPEIRTHMPHLRSLSPAWNALVDVWDELEARLNSEAPKWRTAPRWRAFALFERMSEVLGAVGGES